MCGLICGIAYVGADSSAQRCYKQLERPIQSIELNYNNFGGRHLFFQRARGKAFEVEASPIYERSLRQRDHMDRSYRSPPSDTWNHARYYNQRSPRQGRSGSPAYARINRGHSKEWRTPEGRKRVGSPIYGEMSP